MSEVVRYANTFSLLQFVGLIGALFFAKKAATENYKDPWMGVGAGDLL